MTQRTRLVVPVSERDHRQGPDTAAVTLVQYGDYECPYTRLSTHVVRALQQEIGEQLRFIYRNFPLTEIHPNAKAAAVAAYCAGEQGAYWKMHDALFTNQPRLGPALYDELAKSLDLDAKKFAACREAKESEKKVEDDMAYGQSVGVQGTPHFFIGHLKGGQVVDVQRVSGAQPVAAFTQVIDSLLKDGAAAKN